MTNGELAVIKYSVTDAVRDKWLEERRIGDFRMRNRRRADSYCRIQGDIQKELNVLIEQNGDSWRWRV